MTDLESSRDGSDDFDHHTKRLADSLYDASTKVNGIDKLLTRQKTRKPGSKGASHNFGRGNDKAAGRSAQFDPRIVSLSEEAAQLLKNAKTQLGAVTRHQDTQLNRQQQLCKERMTNEFNILLSQFKKQQKEVAEYQQLALSAAKKDIQFAETIKSAALKSEADANEQTPLINPDLQETDRYGNGDSYNSVAEHPPSPFQQLEQQQQMLDVVRQEDIDFQASLIQEREIEIRAIQEGIAEINSIFKDLGTLVTQQGEQIDSVEDNITDLATNTHSAVDELAKANEYQRKKRNMSLCVLIALIAVLAVVLIAALA